MFVEVKQLIIGVFVIPDVPISVSPPRPPNRILCQLPKRKRGRMSPDADSPFPSQQEDRVALYVMRHDHSPISPACQLPNKINKMFPGGVQKKRREMSSVGRTHELLSIVSVEMGFKVVVSQRIICLSDILENCPAITHTKRTRVSLARSNLGRSRGKCQTAQLTPVVTTLSRSPNQTTLLPLIPPCPSACLIGSEPARGSYILICLSLEVCCGRGEGTELRST